MSKSIRRPLGSAAALGLVAAACAGNEPTAPAGPTSFSRIQAAVFAQACTSCHTVGTHHAVESGLILDSAVAYGNLVAAEPKNATARADGLRRVRAFRPDSSLLYYKLHWEPGFTARDYGNPMPLGSTSLSVGQIEFIRRWIAAGAPSAGDDIDSRLLDDRTAPDLSPFVPLTPPAQGYQLRIERFGVAPRFERELFVYRAVGNPAPAFINRIEMKMRVNSHHFVLYTVAPSAPAAAVPQPDRIRDIRNPDGTLNLLNMATMAYHVFFGGSMTQHTDYRFPAGVALRLPANAMLDLNSHYVNRTDAEIFGEVHANLHTVDSAQVQYVARTLFLSNFDITLPPQRRTTVTKTFIMNTRTTVLMLTSHMHARGERFVIRIAGGPRAGEVVYETTDWAHPDMLTLAQPLILEAGQGLTSEVTYNNTSPLTVRFGLTSEDEMGIIFGYAY